MENNQKPNIYKLCQDMGELKGTIGQMNDTLNRIMENYGTRINTIEKTQDTLIGRVSIFGSIAGFIGGIIVMVIGNFIRK